MQKGLTLFFILFMLICFIFWALSHAPTKRNKAFKRAKIRKLSTIFLTLTMVIALLFLSQPATAFTIALSLVVIHMSFCKLIENL